MATLSQLLDLCRRTYDHCNIVAGLDGRDGANVFTPPGGEVVLCFRGTLANHDFQSALDWMGDMHAELVPADGFPGRVHAGFLGSLNALWDGVIAALEGQQPKLPEPESEPWWKRLLDRIAGPQIFAEEAAPPLPWNKQLIITGHSKGGALAQLAAVRLAALKPRVVTFAAPMVGDLAFASDYPEVVDLLRIEGNFDLVPFLPGHLAGYREIGVNCKTQFPMARHLREIAVGKLIAEGQWAQIRNNHGLATGYRWLKDDPPSTPATEAA